MAGVTEITWATVPEGACVVVVVEAPVATRGGLVGAPPAAEEMGGRWRLVPEVDDPWEVTMTLTIPSTAASNDHRTPSPRPFPYLLVIGAP